jgi:hypothetical protein
LKVNTRIASPGHFPNPVTRTFVPRFAEEMSNNLANIHKAKVCRIAPHLIQQVIDVRTHSSYGVIFGIMFQDLKCQVAQDSSSWPGPNQ